MAAQWWATNVQTSPALATAVRWLQWAEVSQMDVRRIGDQAERDTRHNLSQFWTEKSKLWPNVSEAEHQQLTRLDLGAHRTWAQLENKLTSLAQPGQREGYAIRAAEAQGRAAALQRALDGGKVTPKATYLETRARDMRADAGWADQHIPDASFGTAFKDSAADLLTRSFFGIPVWAWGAAALALVLAISSGPGVTLVQAARRRAA